MSQDPFAPDVVAAVRRHMNDDHAEDCRTIVRGLGGVPDAERAELADVDTAGAVFVAHAPAGPARVRIPWAGPVTARSHLREEVVRMQAEAAARLAEG